LQIGAWGAWGANRAVIRFTVSTTTKSIGDGEIDDISAKEKLPKAVEH